MSESEKEYKVVIDEDEVHPNIVNFSNFLLFVLFVFLLFLLAKIFYEYRRERSQSKISQLYMMNIAI